MIFSPSERITAGLFLGFFLWWIQLLNSTDPPSQLPGEKPQSAIAIYKYFFAKAVSATTNSKVFLVKYTRYSVVSLKIAFTVPASEALKSLWVSIWCQQCHQCQQIALVSISISTLHINAEESGERLICRVCILLFVHQQKLSWLLSALTSVCFSPTLRCSHIYCILIQTEFQYSCSHLHVSVLRQ